MEPFRYGGKWLNIEDTHLYKKYMDTRKTDKGIKICGKIPKKL